MPVNGAPLFIGFLLVLLAVLRWRYGRTHRPPHWLMCVAGFLVTIGLPVWLQAMGALTGKLTGLAVLAVVTFAAGMVFWHEAVRNRKRHPIRTPIVGWVFGSAVAVTVGSFSRMMKQATHLPSQTGGAVASAMHQMRPGQAAGAATPVSHDLPVLAGGAVVVIGLVLLATWSSGRSVKVGRKGSRRSLPSGGSVPGGSSGSRVPVPTGKRR